MRIPPVPPARVDDVVDELHGVAVADPYRWLEDGSSPEVSAWVAAQNARTRAALDALPHRGVLHRRLVELLRTPVTLAPAVRRDRLFALDRAGDADQAVLTLRSSVVASTPARVVLDPVADSGGDLDYKRTFSVPQGVSQNLGKMAIVQHGVDLNHNGRYDFKAAGKSELDPSLPQEATIPANCGLIDRVH